MTASLTIQFGEQSHGLDGSAELTFGRQADLVTGANNHLVHRTMGRFRFFRGSWLLENCGRSVSMVITDLESASYLRLAPGCSIPLPFAYQTLVFSAGSDNYKLVLQQCAELVASRSDNATNSSSSNSSAMPHAGAGIRTWTASRLNFNEEQQALLQALSAPRFAGPVTAADLPSNRQLASELGWSLPKFNRKLDHLCKKFDRAGVQGVVRSALGSATQRRLILANFVVENRLLEPVTESSTV